MRTLLLSAALICLAGAAGAGESKGIFIGETDGIYDPAGRPDPFTLGPYIHGDPEPDPSDAWKEVKRKLADAKPEVRLEGVAEFMTSPAEDAFGRCLKECADISAVLRSTVDYLREHPGEDDGTLTRCRNLLEKCQRLEATSRRLKARRDIEQEFAGLKLRLTGIVTRAGRAAAAAVDGRVVREGDRLAPASAPNSTVTVRRIAPKSVVFLYRGVEVTLGLE